MLSNRGFSLLELLVTIAIISIFLLIGLPNFHEFIVKNRVETQVQQIISAINYARSEAINRNQVITFCKSNNRQTCGGQWRDGQIILAGNEVLRAYSALPEADQLSFNSSLGKDDALQLLPSGFTNGQTGSFNYCSGKDLKNTRRIVIAQTGRMRVTSDNVKCEQ
jgi:type IV fimbrial biogenesis protein FimT